MSRGITLLIGRLPTISGELAGLAASARRVISMMATRVCLLPPPLCPADGARVHVITQISPSALSLLTTLSGQTTMRYRGIECVSPWYHPFLKN